MRHSAKLFWSVMVMGAIAFLPVAAEAQSAFGGCAADFDGSSPASWQITTTIVTCINTSVRTVVFAGMQTLSDYMAPIAAMVFVVALSISAVRIFFGEEEFTRSTLGFLMRLVIVAIFSYNLGGFAAAPFDILDEGANIVSGGTAPWVQIDAAVAQIFGFAPQLSLMQGILGVLSASLFTAGTGFMMFAVGFMVILQIIMLMYRSVYTYLLAVVLVGFCIFVSAILIPAAIFQMGERYVKKWLDTMMAGILIPMMLFAFLGAFFALVQWAIANLMNAMGTNYASIWRLNPPMMDWTVMTDPALFKKLEQAGLNPGKPTVQSFINPLMGRGMDLNMFNFSILDMGPEHFQQSQALLLALVAFGLTLYLVNAMIAAIPGLAQDIAAVMTGIEFEEMPFAGAVGGIGGG